MNQLTVTKNHSGPFIFLEEDHFVAPDLLYMTHLMQDYKERYDWINC